MASLSTRFNIFLPLLLLFLAVAIGVSVRPVALAQHFRLLAEPFQPAESEASILKCSCMPGYLARKKKTGSGYECIKLSDMKTTLACY